MRGTLQALRPAARLRLPAVTGSSVAGEGKRGRVVRGKNGSGEGLVIKVQPWDERVEEEVEKGSKDADD